MFKYNIYFHNIKIKINNKKNENNHNQKWETYFTRNRK